MLYCSVVCWTDIFLQNQVDDQLYFLNSFVLYWNYLFCSKYILGTYNMSVNTNIPYTIFLAVAPQSKNIWKPMNVFKCMRLANAFIHCNLKCIEDLLVHGFPSYNQAHVIVIKSQVIKVISRVNIMHIILVELLH